MKSLHEQFTKTINNIGSAKPLHPVFYNAKYGIRFEIGDPKDKCYIQDKINTEYINNAFDRAKTIYQNLPNTPDLLCIDIYPDGEITPQSLTLDNVHEIGLNNRMKFMMKLYLMMILIIRTVIYIGIRQKQKSIWIDCLKTLYYLILAISSL